MLWQGFGGFLFPCNSGGGGWVSPQSGVGFRLGCNYELEYKCWNMPDFVGVKWYIWQTRNCVLGFRNYRPGAEIPLINQGIFRFL